MKNVVFSEVIKVEGAYSMLFILFNKNNSPKRSDFSRDIFKVAKNGAAFRLRSTQNRCDF
jgi:hypothetical protein